VDELTHQNPASIQEMFGTISKKYDLANTILSAGTHHQWKKRLIRESQVTQGAHVLDCATGTGDLAFLFEKIVGSTGQVVGSDFCQPMLDVAQTKALQSRSRCQFEWGDVTKLKYADQSFDCASISFGIRNVSDVVKGLSELGRVIRPGGRVMVLEFGQPRSRVLGALYHFYSDRILPRMGGWISGKPSAYRYLQSSSAAFPCGEKFLELARKTGKFGKMSSTPLFGGIAYLYSLQKTSS
jgi:demethylmenaquinone methyltransferase/2-methoxy-6-polyprenyl-1,4-benzoquinol methylase